MDIGVCLSEQPKLSGHFDIDGNIFKNLKITAEQKRSLLENLELEFDARILKIKKNAEEKASNHRLKCMLEIEKIPLEIRQLPLAEFINIYHANPKEYFEKKAAEEKKTPTDQITPRVEPGKKRKLSTRYIDESNIEEQSEIEGNPRKRSNREIKRFLTPQKNQDGITSGPGRLIRPLKLYRSVHSGVTPLKPSQIPRSPFMKKNNKELFTKVTSNERENSSNILQMTESQSSFNPKLPVAVTSVKMRKIIPGEPIISLNGSPLFNPFSMFQEKGSA
ncbi:5074_t:CDS:2 [Acaulospora morrowiae]|uniref:5074_t:CDS:1 n=1 Tax=Acaulospora morrowiae TaxID=94023 RepID=A0A9N9EQ21_9GLOM|nr:5074_t:CDS:2 [Acaulospora morrowiae]